MDDYISKPINEQQLYKLIHKFASASTDEDLAVIDIEYLRSLSKGDEAFERKMMKAFSEQVPGELNELKNAIHLRDYKKVESSAHTMKSTVSYLGLHQLAPLLEQIEIDSRNKDGISRITENFMSVDATCQLAIKEVNKLMVFDKNQIDQ